jgi:uncharacterized membrane protein
MSKGRLEAFSDAVIAIIMTIMVLELRVPDGADIAALRTLAPVFSSYVLSFVFLGIYWNNHHHLWQAAKRVNGRGFMGEPASAVLVVPGSFCDWLDGRE